MAKKLKAKDKRLQQELAKQEKIRAIDNARKEAAEKAAAEKAARAAAEAAEKAARAAAEAAEKEALQRAERERAEKEALENSVREKLEKKGVSVDRSKKSRAKAAGLKSTFIIDNSLLMTSFGKGNNAVMEHRISGESISTLREIPAFAVSHKDNTKSFNISGKNNLSAVADDPRGKGAEIRSDLIGAKDALERRFFKKNFADNIHIQLIYNILDIEKILSKHINNVVYAINNMRGVEGNEYDDFAGYLSLDNSYDTFLHPDTFFDPDKDAESNAKTRENIQKLLKKFEELLRNPRLGYFGSAFCETHDDARGRREKSSLRDSKDIYYMLALLGEIRQSLAHSKARSRDSMYNLDKESAGKPDRRAAMSGVRDTLSSLYKQRVSSLNDDFISHAKKDLTLIFGALDIQEISEKDATVKLYYDFVVRKTSKNIGFSLKKIRERIMEETGIDTQSEKFSSVRQKFYKIIDFIIFRRYLASPDEIERNVAELRSAVSDIQKEVFYEKESLRIWNIMRELIMGKVYPKINGEYIRSIVPDPDISERMLDGVMIDGENTEYFSKMIYMLTMFLDGKEINDLLTTLISKFENIDSFICVMKENGLDTNFSEKYGMFLRSANIASELREINSFARMEKPAPDAKKQMFIDAAVILGTDADEQAISVYFDEVLDKSKGKLNSRGKKDNSLRNFIARNVIESDRFRYLTRYSNPQNVRMLAQNHTVVEFVLGELPDKQIDRYCQACGIRTAGDRKARVRALTDIITDMNFKQFEDVRQQAKSREENMMKQKLQSLISLYLTVLYILTKNLVNVNSRYFLAFHCLERDSELLKITAGAYGRPYSAITADFIERNQLNSHARRYMQTNIENSDEWAIACYRDHAAHLGAVRNAHAYIDGVKSIRSYFELYHYVTQRAISDRYDYEAGNGTLPNGINPATLRYFALVKENGWYCKDFVKALNVAFGYNLPRYKNLTIDGLFDKDRPFEISEDEKF